MVFMEATLSKSSSSIFTSSPSASSESFLRKTALLLRQKDADYEQQSEGTPFMFERMFSLC
jgi:hypothetical protein